MAISITDTFEGTDGAALTTSTDKNVSAVPLVSGSTAVYSAADAKHGATGVRFTTVLNGAAAVQYNTPDNQYLFSVSLWMKMPSSPMTADTNLLWFLNTNGHHALALAWRYGSSSSYGIYFGDNANTFVPMLLNSAVGNSTWYRITLTADLTSTTSAVIVGKVYNTNGTLVGSGSTSIGNGGGYPVQYVVAGLYGNNTAATSLAIDDFQLVTGSTTELPPYTPAVNAPPTVSVGGPYTTQVGSPVTLIGSASDADGTVQNMNWAPQDWPGSTNSTPTSPPYVGNSSSNNASVTLSTPGTYRFTFTATDNLGASSSATATVYVTDTTAVPISTTANYGWTGTAAYLSDGNDATYIESPATASGGSSYTVRLAPLSTPDSFNLTVRAYLSAASSSAATSVSLLEGSTIRKSWTINPTTTATDYVLSMTPADIQTVGSWSALDVQIGWQTTGLQPVGVSSPTGSWNMVFSDEFAGTAFDSSVWDPQDGYTGQNNVTVLASNISVSNSIVNLTLSDSGHGAQMATINPIFNVGDYVEFRAKFPGDGTNYYNWPAVWTSGPNWPANGEIDVAEVLSSQLTYNYHGTTNSVNYPPLSTYYGNTWHTFGAYRHSNTFDIYYDGAAVRTGMPTGDSGGPENIILTMGYSPSGTPSIGAQLQVDYVRTFRPA